jgi:hypothetical protein
MTVTDFDAVPLVRNLTSTGEPKMSKFLSLVALSIAAITLAGVVAQPLAAQ